MATTFFHRAVRPSFFSLPPALRLALHHPHLPRAFSATPTRKLSLVDVAVTPPTYLLDALHATGLPWFAALPAAAVLVRGVLVYYLSVLPSYRAARIQANLVPLAFARAHGHNSSPAAMRRREVLPPRWVQLDFYIRGFCDRQMQLHRLGKQFGAPRFHPRGVLNFVALIAFTESIRMKCASHEGLLPIVLWPFEKVARLVNPGTSSTPPPTPPPDPAAKAGSFTDDQLRAATITNPDGTTSIDPTLLISQAPASPPDPSAYAAYFDPTLQNEGLPWCLDLTAADTTFILPTTLAVVTAANIIFGSPTQARRPPPSYPNLSNPTTAKGQAPNVDIAPPRRSLIPRLTNFQRIGLSITLGFWFVALKIPAGILLYFVTSLLVGRLQRRWLEIRMPPLTPVQPCTRPLRFRVRKEWVD
ncbi:hypothetical protein B0A50_05759 [Salinomyces thailandicus]|uniref:Uncharacterized protein n=1 Tax=Salinomyces thailandicus TaxID=706561 RepID=A0A4U0TRH6_9PEZI|nr:hypothetical protein B0A50_05759 [Salinomyces thailandica]